MFSNVIAYDKEQGLEKDASSWKSLLPCKRVFI